MAIFTPGPIVTDIRGSIGGTTFTVGTSGNIAKRRSGPRNSVKGLRSVAKNNLAGVAKAYTQLSTTQQASWRSFASANPVPKRLGGTQVLSANAMYMYLNGILQAIGHPIQNSPPLSLFVDPITGFTIDALAGPQGHIHVTGFGDGISDPELFQFWLTAPLGAGRTTPASGYWKVPIEWQASGEAIDVTAEWIQRFGALPSLGGQTILGAARIINKANGAHTPLITASAQFGDPIPFSLNDMILSSGYENPSSSPIFLKPDFNAVSNNLGTTDSDYHYNFLVPVNGTLRALSARANSAAIGGDLHVNIFINGTGPELNLVLPSGTAFAQNLVDVANVSAGDMVQFQLTDVSDAGWQYIIMTVQLAPT